MKMDGSLTDRLMLQMKSVSGGFNPGDTTVCTAPARMDVLGGLSLEAGGVVAQMALPCRAGVALLWRDDDKMIFMGRQHGQKHQPVILPRAAVFSPGNQSGDPVIARANDPPSAWTAPLLNVFQSLINKGFAISPKASARGAIGATVVVDSDIRAGSGQAASTAVTAALLQAVNVSCGLSLSAIQKAGIISEAQRAADGNHGHMVDALTVLSAQDGPPAHLLRYSAQPHSLLGQIPLSKDIRILALDTGVTRATNRDIFGDFHLTGAMGAKIIETIYRDLGQRHNPVHGYLGNVSPELYRRYFRSMLPRRVRGADFLRTYGALDASAGEIVPNNMYAIRTTLDHLINEYEHAEHFLQAMEELSESSTDTALTAQRQLIMQRAGRLLLASHHSYRLRLQLSCPQADWLVDQFSTAGPKAGAYGARITDCGGGGTVAVLLDTSDHAMDVLLSIISRYKDEMGMEVIVREAGIAGSAGALI
jgi:galactokinase